VLQDRARTVARCLADILAQLQYDLVGANILRTQACFVVWAFDEPEREVAVAQAVRNFPCIGDGQFDADLRIKRAEFRIIFGTR